MKRDMDLLRQLLLEVEQLHGKDWAQIEIPGHTTEEIVYHAHLAEDTHVILRRAPNDTISLHSAEITRREML